MTSNIRHAEMKLQCLNAQEQRAREKEVNNHHHSQWEAIDKGDWRANDHCNGIANSIAMERERMALFITVDA